MKRQVIVDLIKAHYEDDPRLFFSRTIDVLKEFNEDGADELVDYLDFIIKSKVKIAPKRVQTPYEPEISFEEAEKLGWIMDWQTQDEDFTRTNREDEEFMRKQEKLKQELGFSLLDICAKPQDGKYAICPKCGSTNIEANRDINNAFIRCKDCGHYLREGKSHE